MKDLFSSFDYIDEIIYICDMDTYDLVYCNKKTKTLLVSEYQEGAKGYKCYKCLQGLDHPCIFCNNEKLKKEKHCIWMRRHQLTDKKYLIHDEVLNVGDGQYRLELAVDATRMEEAIAETRGLLEVENHLTRCVRRLVRSSDFSASVNAVLQTVLNYYGGERAYLFEFDWKKEIGINTFEICASGISPEIDNLQGIPIEDMHFWIDSFSDQAPIIIEDLCLLEHDESRREEYETLAAQGINSLIAVPIFTDDKLTGFVGVDNPHLNFDNSDFLVELSYFIGIETEKNRYLTELKEISMYDSLGDVSNRYSYAQLLRNDHRENNFPVGVAFLDMNGLKYLNDTFGHVYGDRQIKKLCEILLRFYSRDQVFRISGDEFVIVDYGVSYENFNATIESLKTELYDGQKGMAAVGHIWDDSQTPISQLQNRAEQHMYEEKHKTYAHGESAERSERPEFISDIIETMKKEKYLVYFQPGYDLHENSICGAEALVRKMTPEGQLVYPLEFVSALEKEKAVSFLDFYVFEEVCTTLKSWSDKGYPRMFVSINISRSTLAEADFCSRILEICERTGVDCSQLIIEVEEISSVMHMSKLVEIMKKLKEHGIRFALDNVGTEYATLEMLEIEELDMVKIDRSLTRRVNSSPRSAVIFRKLIELYHSLGMECSAEGVENQEQLQAIRDMGCDIIQGFYMSRAVPASEFEEEYLMNH